MENWFIDTISPRLVRPGRGDMGRALVQLREYSAIHKGKTGKGTCFMLPNKCSGHYR